MTVPLPKNLWWTTTTSLYIIYTRFFEISMQTFWTSRTNGFPEKRSSQFIIPDSFQTLNVALHSMDAIFLKSMPKY